MSSILEINKFCSTECPLGQAKSSEFLDKSNSGYEAAMDMHFFIEECVKTCPYKDKFQNG